MRERFLEIRNSSSISPARTGLLRIRESVIETPAFMPVGTQGTVKAMTPEEVEAIGYRLILANTFHLELRPGSSVIEKLGGLHRFMNWPHAILTDSGGFQVFSLSAIRKVSEEGVIFRSPFDGSESRLTPESAIQIQHRLGSDIVMAFDECLPFGAERERTRDSVELTLRWLARCKREHEAVGGESRLFGIAQGGFFADLRRESAQRSASIDLPGYAIGGLAVGEPEPVMMEMLAASLSELPADRPRYAMGVGLPLNLIDMAAMGVDLFDCVVPTRNARNGRLYTFQGTVIVKHAEHRESSSPIEEGCPCEACRGYSRAYLRHLHASNEILFSRLATLHNLTFFHRLMERIREAIGSGSLPALRSGLEGAFNHDEHMDR